MNTIRRQGKHATQWPRAAAREEIRQSVVRDGWPIVGFLPGDDPRILSTVDAIAERLTDERGLVYRYRTEAGVDGLAFSHIGLVNAAWAISEAERSANVPDPAPAQPQPSAPGRTAPPAARTDTRQGST